MNSCEFCKLERGTQRTTIIGDATPSYPASPAIERVDLNFKVDKMTLERVSLSWVVINGTGYRMCETCKKVFDQIKKIQDGEQE